MAKKSTSAPFASVPLEESSSTPLYYQVYQRLRAAILLGQLSPGTRLPSTRQMANDLGVSRNTMMSAFDQLIAEGYVEGRVGSGTFVSPTLPEELLEARLKTRPILQIQTNPRSLSARGQAIGKTSVTVAGPAGRLRPFIPGIPALDQFPMSLWSRLVARRWRDESRGLLNYGPAAGHPPLREAIAAYLGPSRGVQCKPDQIVIVSGTQQALDLSARVLLDPGDSVLVEEYCYSAARAALIGAGARLVPIKVDDAGLDISTPAASSSNARVAYVTPSHQYPLGTTMSASRRFALLDWAARNDAWILEDDYDSEFRYISRPVGALQGMDAHDRVIYMGTFSKALFPALRVGYIVVPPALWNNFVQSRFAFDLFTPTLYQRALAEFLKQGHFARHLRRMRSAYLERRDALLRGLALHCRDQVQVHNSDAGLHVAVLLREGLDDHDVATRLGRRGVAALTLSSSFVGPTPKQGLLLGFGCAEPERLLEATRILGDVLRESA